MSSLRSLLLSAALLALCGCPQNRASGASSSSASAAASASTSTGGTSSTSSAASSSGTSGSSGASASSSGGATTGSASSGAGSTGTSSTGASTGATATSSSGSSGTTGPAPITWSSMSLPAGVEGVYSVTGYGVNDVYASGDIGKLLHWNGSVWGIYWDSQSNDQIKSIALTESGQIYAVGSSVYACLQDCADPSNMTTLSTSSTGCYPTAVCSSNNSVYVVGQDGNNLGCMLTADGQGGWSHTALNLYQPNTCWVDPTSGTVYIGSHGGIDSYNTQFGASTETINWPTGTGNNNLYVDFYSIWGDGQHLFAVGGNRRVFSKGSSGWDLVLNVSSINPNSEDSSFDALAGAGSEAFAFGDDLGTHQAAHWDGSAWHYLPASIRGSAFLAGAWAATPDDYFVVGTASIGQGLILRGHR